MFAFFRRTKRASKMTRQQAATWKPSLEVLEDRTLLSTTTVINFDTINASGTGRNGVGGSTVLDYLAGYGITVSGDEMRVCDSREFLNPVPQPPFLVPFIMTPSAPNFLETGASDTLTFDAPVESLSFTRIGLHVTDSGGTTHPQWTAQAFDSQGNLLSSVGEPLIASFSDVPERQFTLNGPGIASVRFTGNNFNFAGFADVVLDDLVITKNNPDIIPTTLAWDTTQGGVDFGYEVSGSALTQDTTAALYWSPTPTFDPQTATLAYETQINQPADEAQGDHGPFFVSGADLATAPLGTTNLLLVVDPQNSIAESDETNNVQALVVPTSAEIVQSAVHTYITDAQNGSEIFPGVVMNATFTPNFGFTLATAAHLSGYDHFNWLQVVRAAPNPPDGAHVPFFDPLPGGGPAFGGYADNLPFYWDEGPDNNPPYHISSHTFTSLLDFSDMPHDSKLLPGQFIAFTTSLVGVVSDIKWKELYTFTWSTNFNGSVGGITQGRNIDPPTSGTGGIFDLVQNVDSQTLPRSVRELLAASGGENVSLAGPLLDQIADVTATEGSLVSIAVSANDSDPTRTLTYSLDTAPDGAKIDPNTGIFAWTPTQTQSPGVYYVIVRVSDDGSPSLNDTTAFTIRVKAKPSFSELASTTIITGTSTTTIAGRISRSSLIPTGSVLIALNGVSESAAINPDGTFSAVFNTSALGVGAYRISYSYDGDSNFTAATGESTLNVTYNVTALFDQSQPRQAGSTLPIQLGLTDANGNDVSSSSTHITALGIASALDPNDLLPADDPGNSYPDSQFKYSGGRYQYNLKTPKTLAPGTYLFYFMIDGDPIVHSVQFEVK